MQEAPKLKAFFQSNKPMLLLLGNYNAHRAELLTQAATFTTPDQMVLRLKGRTTYEPSTLAALFKNHWAINNIKSTGKQLNAQFDEILTCLTAQKQTCVLLIDHANLLPISVLAALCHLSHQQENQFIAVRIILAGRESLAANIEALCLKKFAFPSIIELPNCAPPAVNLKKKKAANKSSLWKQHRIKSIAAAGLLVSSMVLWQLEHHRSASKFQFRQIAHQKRLLTNA